MNGTKETNPKDAIGVTKAPLSTVPLPVLAEVGVAMTEGSAKYGRSNYRVAGVRASVYFDAMWRHMAAWFEGEDIDPDSGLSHVTKAIAGLMILRDSMMQGNWQDDRPPKSVPFINECNKKVSELLDKFPDAVTAYTQKGLEGQATRQGQSEIGELQDAIDKFEAIL